MTSETKLPRRDVPVRIYVHEAVISVMVTGVQRLTPKVTRHDAILLVSLNGKPFTVHTDKASITSEAVMVAPNAAHAVDGEGCQMLRVVVYILHPQFVNMRGKYTEPATAVPMELLAGFLPRLKTAYRGDLDCPQATKLMDDIVAMLMADSPPPAPLDPRILFTLRKLEADIDHPFDDIAQQLGVSQSRLSHLFTEYLGVSLRGTQAWGRMGIAWEMVTWKRPDLSLTEIAHMMAFSDSSHLSRVFKRRFGMTPTMFRDPNIVEIIHNPLPDLSRVTELEKT